MYEDSQRGSRLKGGQMDWWMDIQWTYRQTGQMYRNGNMQRIKTAF